MSETWVEEEEAKRKHEILKQRYHEEAEEQNELEQERMKERGKIADDIAVKLSEALNEKGITEERRYEIQNYFNSERVRRLEQNENFFLNAGLKNKAGRMSLGDKAV